MFDNLQKILYKISLELKISMGLKTGRIVLFDDSFYEKLKHTYISCLPVSIHIKYLKPITPPGRCYDRSLYMFFCFNDALLVCGNNYDLEIEYGKKNSEHCWIEIGDKVFDPSLLACIDKDLYYELYKPSDVREYNKDDYCKIDCNKKIYDDVISTKVDDYLPGGKKRHTLLSMIPLVNEIANLRCDKNFRADLDEWLKLINYDEEQINKEINQKVFKIK